MKTKRTVAEKPRGRAEWRVTVDVLSAEEHEIVTKIRTLSPEERASLRRIVGHADTSGAEALRDFGHSRKVFAQIWDNPDDAEYDDLV
jgi:hypothetical protein